MAWPAHRTAMHKHRVLTVSELNTAIRGLLENRFPFVHVAGEVSNLRKPYSGHQYFTLKDANSQLKAVLFKLQQRYLSQELKDGQRVVCKGRISVYEPRGDYQLIVDTVDFHGAGLLQQEFIALKKKLAAEGLFDEHLKKTLPPFPEHITLVTSPRGAAVHDFIRIAAKRWPMVRIAVFPAAVQGDQAAGEIAEAIRLINRHMVRTTDLIVLCRGGGSIEDLWAFNDEYLARAIFDSTIPVVSAIGHEIDFTIADFVADFRAPTPSGAAEALLPDSSALMHTLSSQQARLSRHLDNLLNRCQDRLRLYRQRLGAMPHPLESLMQRLDQLGLSLQMSLFQKLADKRQQVHDLHSLLEEYNPATTLLLNQQKVDALQARIVRAGTGRLEDGNQRLRQMAGVLDAVSPLATLARGYAVVQRIRPRGQVVTDAGTVRTDEQVDITLHRGAMRCRVVAVEKEAERDHTASPGEPL